MATLQIRKATGDGKVWQHIDSDFGEFIISKMYCKTDNIIFKIVEEGGSKRRSYNFADVTIYNDTESVAPFTATSSLQLMVKLSELNYVGFSEPGGISIADYVSSLPGNAITVINGQLFSTGGGGQSYTGANLPATNPANRETEMLNPILQNIYNLATQPDEIITMAPLIINGNDVTIPINSEWVLNVQLYTNNAPVTFEIPNEPTGFKRNYLIVANEQNGFDLIAGESTDSGSAVNPIRPTNTLIVTTIRVDGDSMVVDPPVVALPAGRGQNKAMIIELSNFNVDSFEEVTPEMIRDYGLTMGVMDIENYKIIIEQEDTPVIPSVLSFTMDDLAANMANNGVTDLEDVSQWNGGWFFNNADFEGVLIEGNKVTLTASTGSELAGFLSSDLPITNIHEISGFSLNVLQVAYTYTFLTEFNPIMTNTTINELDLSHNSITEPPILTQTGTINLRGNPLSESGINNFLIAMRDAGVTGKVYDLLSNNGTYPTGDGVIALNYLVSAGNEITVNQAP